MKNKIEKLFAALIEKHELTLFGEPILPNVYQVQEHVGSIKNIIFEDESMTPLLAGNVAERIYDEMEAELKKLGYVIMDTSGASLKIVKE